MNKNKITTGILLLSVVLIWGTIFFKILRREKQNDGIPMTEISLKPVEDTGRKNLRLNYSDPFLREFGKRTSSHEKSLESERKPKKIPSTPSVDFTFKGIIKNGMNQSAMLIRNGELYLCARGDSVGAFRIVSMNPEVMTLSWQKNLIEIEAR